MATVAGMLSELTLDEYKSALAYYREHKLNAIFDNDTYENARALIAELARSVKEEGLIQIHTSVFCDTVFGSDEVLESFKQAADRGAALHVLAAETMNGKVIDDYRKMFGDHYKEAQNTPAFGERIDREGKTTQVILNNFMVVDKIAFRYEQQLFRAADYDKDCHVDGRPKMNAVGCFNDAFNAGKLNNYFTQHLS